MLKTLEEPPEHVKFILATTDPQKIPVTVLSRCLQFNLKQMPAAAITSHLAHILQAEEISHDAPALALIARSAAGSMRDALSLLDQAIAHGAGKVEEGQVRAMLGTVDQDYLFAILEALAAGDASAMLAVAADLGVRSLSFAAALQELATLLTRIQIAQCVPTAIDDEEPERERLLAIATAFSPEFIQLAYQIALVGRSELSAAPDEYAGFVMTLLRLHAFRPSSVADVVAASRQRGAGTSAATPNLTSTLTPVPQAQARAASPAADDREHDWGTIIAALPLSGLARTLAQHCELRHLDEGECLLRLTPAQTHLQMKPAPERLQQALSDYFARPLRLRIELAANEEDTPAATADRERQTRQVRAEAAIAQDDFVRGAIESLDASVIEASIKPIA
jgi:DNA polymerase-3 subunit gamma/tau